MRSWASSVPALSGLSGAARPGRVPRIPAWARGASRSPWPAPTPRPPRARGDDRVRVRVFESRGGYRSFGPDSGPGGRRFRSSPYAPYVVGFAAAGGVGYYVVHLDYAPYTGRRRCIDISRGQEIAIGDQAFQQLLQQYDAAILPREHPDARRVRRVGLRIAQAVRRTHPELVEGYEFDFVTVGVGEANAMCVPGGKVAVFQGLLALTPNDDALAAVLTHEVAHAIQRHSAERLAFMKVLVVIQFFLQSLFDFGGFSSLFVQVAMNLPYGRTLEHEADVVGLQLMADSCYNPRASPGMFQRLADVEGAGGKQSRAQSLLSTHPMFSDRIRLIREKLPEAARQYDNSCVRHEDTWAEMLAQSSRSGFERL